MRISGTRSEGGASLVELLLIIVIIGSCVFLMANLPNAFMLVNKAKHLSLAREIASKQIEDKRTINYTNLVNDTSAINDSRISLLPQGVGSVIIADCDSQVCTNEENVKKITVTVSWKDNNKLQSVTLNTFIAEGGINQ